MNGSTPRMDYFGALLRSAGRAGGGAPVQVHAPALPALPALPGADLVEIDVAHETHRPDEAGTAAARRPQPNAVPLHMAGAGLPTADGQRPGAPRPSATPEQHDPRAAAPEAIDLSPPPVHSAVQAALAWVASDPRGRGDLGAVQVARAEGTVARDQGPLNDMEDVAQRAGAVALPQGVEVDVDVHDDDGDDDLPANAAVDRRSTATPAAALAPAPAVGRYERRARAQSAQAQAPAPREEVIEITIGAIHLHVDAPPQAGITPASTPPPAAPSLRSPTPRSALSRRALYRL